MKKLLIFLLIPIYLLIKIISPLFYLFAQFFRPIIEDLVNLMMNITNDMFDFWTEKFNWHEK